MADGSNLHTVVEDRLRGIDQRYTSGRRAIIDLLVSEARPLSISDIADLLPDLPRSSAYRHLVDLQAAGVVRRVAAHDEYTRFELDEDLTEHHHHLLCTKCGTVIDIRPTAHFERTLASQLYVLANGVRFQAQSHRVDVLGLCAACH